MGNFQFPLSDAKTWSKVRIEALGVLDTGPEDLKLLGQEVVVFGEEEAADTFARNPKNGKPIRTNLVFINDHTWRLGGDSLVCETFHPTPAGSPEELSQLAEEGTHIRTANEGGIQFQNDTPDFIWEQIELYSAVTGLVDPEIGVEIILHAISVAPKDVLPILYAALAQRYEESLNI